ncbi:MAG: hypothetical protein QOE14_421 [Humisphaera sp.]|nr:hypothetical protein [Humisphaera sp.]
MNLRLCFTAVTITVLVAAGTRASGQAIPIQPGDEPWVVTKVRVTDCRAVRGFIGAPVDGSTKSGAWDGKMWEYPMRAGGVGVQYSYLNADGLHLTLADDAGFNAVVIRGGAKAKLIRDVQQYDKPESGQLVYEFPGNVKTSRAWFDEAVKTRKLSFFNVSKGLIADASFFRVRRGLGQLKSAEVIDAGAQDKEMSLAAIGVNFETTGDLDFTVTVMDPLNPRLALHDADYRVTGAGRVHLICDFPDQVLPPGTKLSVAVECAQSEKIKNLEFKQYTVAKAQAASEALEHRKFILHALYTPVSEARPWNVWNNPGDDEKYFSQPADTGDALQDRLRPWVREIVMTLDQCRALDPEGKDPIVRQYHEWIYRKILTKTGRFPAFATKFDTIEGVPKWASLVHQAWMQSREVPRWWIENRLAPNGEFGGLLGDDTDMYQNYAPFPMLERDGVGGMLLDAAARAAETLERENLEHGMNKESMDPLHAYEEGLNHESLVAYWNYGDPIYFERCMAAARSTEPQTMLTEKGHRHFRSNTLGVAEITAPRPPDREHGSHCLMWHPTLITAWYNRHPLAMKWLAEWGDGWLAHMEPGKNATHVKLPDDVTTQSDPLPFAGGWGMTGSIFTFLADLTGDARFVRSYAEYFSTQKKNTGFHFAELQQMGMTDAQISDPPWNSVLYATGDKAPFIAAIRKDVEELQRFPHLYTTVECFTDRVFLYAAINPAIAYTGGYTTRNKLNFSYAVSWTGFGTDYAALVTSATRDHLKVLLCNVSEKPITGQARVWRLDAGDYELTVGPDADTDDVMDRAERKETLTITKGDELVLTLPPKVVQIVELKQTRKGEAIFNRADLAIAGRELKLANGTLTGVVHNIGVKEVDEVVVAIVDNQGRVIQTKNLGPLAAPLDLLPRTLAFQFDNIPPAAAAVIVDPSARVAEIFEGNNHVAFDGIPHARQ